MHIVKEHALSNRSTCSRCEKTIPMHAPRARIKREYEPGKTRSIFDTYCRDCALKRIDSEIHALQRERYEMEVYK